MINFRDSISKVILLSGDVLGIYISICIAYGLRVLLNDTFSFNVSGGLEMYTGDILVYLVLLLVFYYERLYTHRFDFWEETRFVFKGVLISLVLVLSILALNKNIEEYSRFVIVMSFFIMLFIIPLLKNILKKQMFKLGIWKRKAEVCGNDAYLGDEVFGNTYLGYIHTNQADSETIFIDTKGLSSEELQERLNVSLREKKEVLFVPILQAYNFSNARIIELSNARINLIVLDNSLLKKSNILIKKVSDLVLSVMLFPLLVILFGVIIILMKREEPNGRIFFKQKRMGLNGEEFICYKFRSMYENGDEILEEYLKDNPDEIVCYDKYHKYKNDPRITRIGHIMRKTSLDEVPQIINVLRGEMSLIGPRPYMPNEKEKISDRVDMVLAVKPGITGLWQVSGRSDVDFHERVDIDVWYTRNWNLWLDLVILVKTIKVVLFRDGAS